MTTIITKHGTGVPSSLQVGELAIDKSEPAIYTNTGTGVEKLTGAASSGGGGAGTSGGFGQMGSATWSGELAQNIISLTGTHASKLNVNPSSYHGTSQEGSLVIKANTSFNSSAGTTCFTMNAAAGRSFTFLVAPSSSGVLTPDAYTEAKSNYSGFNGGSTVIYLIAYNINGSGTNTKFTSRQVLGSSFTAFMPKLPGQQQGQWWPYNNQILTTFTTTKIDFITASDMPFGGSTYVEWKNLIIN